MWCDCCDDSDFYSLVFHVFYPVFFYALRILYFFYYLINNKKVDVIKICGIYSYMNTKNTNLSTVDSSHWDKGPVYLFSNENTAGTVKGMGDLSGRKILSVCASGDFVLDGYLAGAKQIDIFDINSYQYAALELKTHMVKNLTYERFKDFFFSEAYFFDTRLLQSFSDDFSDLLKEFISTYKNVSGKHMFKYYGASFKWLKDVNASYLKSSENYYSLRERLLSMPQIKFHKCTLEDLSAKITEKYDDMYFSNIYNYVVKEDSKFAAFMEFYKSYLVDLSKYMSDEKSRIFFRYMWGITPEQVIAWRNVFECQLKDLPHTFHTNCIDAAFIMDKYDMVMSMRQKNR